MSNLPDGGAEESNYYFTNLPRKLHEKLLKEIRSRWGARLLRLLNPPMHCTLLSYQKYKIFCILTTIVENNLVANNFGCFLRVIYQLRLVHNHCFANCRLK